MLGIAMHDAPSPRTCRAAKQKEEQLHSRKIKVVDSNELQTHGYLARNVMHLSDYTGLDCEFNVERGYIATEVQSTSHQPPND